MICLGSVVARKPACVRVLSLAWGGGKKSLSEEVVSALWNLVLRVFLRWASRCPMAVASKEGAYLCKVALVRPVNGGKNPLCNALVSVDMAGENSAAWANATRSAGVFDGVLIAGAAMGEVSGEIQAGGVSITEFYRVHSPSWFLGQCTAVPSGVVIVHWCLVNVTWHLWSHRGASASKEVPSSGKVCACRAACGSPLMGISPVWEE